MSKQIVVNAEQAHYTEEQAQALAEIAGYQDASDWAEDHGYLRCVDRREYMIEPAGYSEEYNGYLCSHCARESDMDAATALTTYLKQHGAELSAAQIRSIGIARRAAQYRSWKVADLHTALQDTLPLHAADPKPIYMIGPSSAAYILSILQGQPNK
jgi:hypothetical protein